MSVNITVNNQGRSSNYETDPNILMKGNKVKTIALDLQRGLIKVTTEKQSVTQNVNAASLLSKFNAGKDIGNDVVQLAIESCKLQKGLKQENLDMPNRQSALQQRQDRIASLKDQYNDAKQRMLQQQPALKRVQAEFRNANAVRLDCEFHKSNTKHIKGILNIPEQYSAEVERRAAEKGKLNDASAIKSIFKGYLQEIMDHQEDEMSRISRALTPLSTHDKALAREISDLALAYHRANGTDPSFFRENGRYSIPEDIIFE